MNDTDCHFTIAGSEPVVLAVTLGGDDITSGLDADGAYTVPALTYKFAM